MVLGLLGIFWAEMKLLDREKNSGILGVFLGNFFFLKIFNDIFGCFSGYFGILGEFFGRVQAILGGSRNSACANASSVPSECLRCPHGQVQVSLGGDPGALGCPSVPRGVPKVPSAHFGVSQVSPIGKFK